MATKNQNQVTSIKPGSYERRSSEGEDRQVASLETQFRENSERAKRDGLTIPKEYQIRESRSAKYTGKRDGFEKMLHLIEKGKVNVLYVWGAHRISRNAIDTARVIDLMDRGLLHEVRTPEQVFTNTPADKMMLTLLCTMAKLENDTKGKNVVDGLKTKAKSGEYPSQAPIGYMNSGTEKGRKKVVPDPLLFPIVRKMWDLMLTGRFSPPKILKIATEQWGLRTRKRGRGGDKKLSNSNAYYLFNNPFYYGEFEWPRGSGTWYRGNHKPMITREEFDRVQFLLGRKSNPRAKRLQLPYRGLMSCGECGAAITVERKYKKLKDDSVKSYTFFHCTHHKNQTCKQRSVEIGDLEAQMGAELARFDMPLHLKRWCVDTLREMRDTDKDRPDAVLESQRRQVEACTKKLDALIDMRANGELEENEYREKKAAVAAEKAELERLIAEAGTVDTGEWLDVAERGFDFTQAMVNAFESDDTDLREVKSEIIRTVGSNHGLKDKKLSIRADILIESIGKVAEVTSAVSSAFEPTNIGSTQWRNFLLSHQFSYLLPG